MRKEASRVLESRFPSTWFVEGGVDAVDEEEVHRWACKYSQAALVLIRAGPPCQGVSGLNADRRGALKDHRSSLFVRVDRIRALVKEKFPWAQVRYLAESVASMDSQDRKVMSESLGIGLIALMLVACPLLGGLDSIGAIGNFGEVQTGRLGSMGRSS